MKGEVDLPALEAANPLGFLAALGTLDVLERADRAASLRWTDELVPHAVVGGAGDVDELIGLVDADRDGWRTSVLLDWPQGRPLDDLKPDADELRRWAEAVFAEGEVAEAELFCSLVAEGAVDGSGKTKPTHLHFTAGQQRFLSMVRELADQVGVAELQEALLGPWRHASRLPSLSWDSRGDRVFALRGFDPSKDKRLGIPGADWLAFLGLRFFPVTNVRSSLRTTACDPGWRRGAFRWPAWSVPLGASVVRSLLSDPELVSDRAADRRLEADRLRARGVIRVFEARIRRSDQGGYGSFGAPDTLVDVGPGRGPGAP